MQWIGIFLLSMLCINAHGSEENIKEGKIVLKDARKDPKNTHVVQVGEKVVLKVNAYIDDFMKDAIINANAKLTNLTDGTQQVTYSITFYDDDENIVGAYATSWTLDANEATNFGGALIKGKLEDFKRVTSYRLYACSYETLPED